MSATSDLKKSLSWAIEVLRVRNMSPLQKEYLTVMREFNQRLAIGQAHLPETEWEEVNPESESEKFFRHLNNGEVVLRKETFTVDEGTFNSHSEYGYRITITEGEGKK